MLSVIGAGLVGRAIIDDLSNDFDLAVFDRSKKALSQVETGRKYSDDIFSRKQVLERSELVISTLPGSVAYPVVRKLLRSGKKVVDTSFMEEDPFSLDSGARRSGALYIPDAGYAPGTTNVLAGRLFKKEGASSIEIIVAGLPLKAAEPFLHAATFNVEGLIDEYTRPARIVRGGSVATVDPLGDIGRYTFQDEGEFDSFYTDGLRTLLTTLRVREMYEKTLRYPGHLQLMKALRGLGYFSTAKVGGAVPRRVSEELFASLESDFRDMCLTSVTGMNGGRRAVYTNVDRYRNGMKSMARMTGYAASSMSRIVLDGMVDSTGVYPPEYFGFSDSIFPEYMRLLSRKGIRFDYRVEEGQ